ncbi:MAG TPA: alpha/beta fold hydrolase [Steroidobacteraceae bacterium]|nr:alpha/beta fold hydrolase [Steroidobacteraceae bacterium]
MRKTWGLLSIGAAIILAGCLLAHWTQTTGGIRIQDVRFTGSNATPMSALLYVPSNATTKTPAPGILAVHGYINSRETQSAFAIEYARRGYVVLSLDQTGHGYSGGFAFGNGFGGPDGLKYLRSLDFVDRENIGLEGHSMGGGSILAAAQAYPNDYKSMVLEGSATGTLFSPKAAPNFPRNVAVVFSQYDEFSQLMWSVARAKDVAGSEKLKGLFGTEEDVATQKLYGSIDAGTARVLYTPATTHPGDHISFEAVGDSLDWFAKTLVGAKPMERDDQVWHWKEIGTGVALVGFALLLLGAFELLISRQHFAPLRQSPQAASVRRDARWWGSLALTAFVPVLSYYYFFGLGGQWMPASKYFPQSITNQIVVWALLNGAITLVLGRLLVKSKGESRSQWLLSLQIALATVGIGYLSLVLADYFFKVDFRFWVVALKVLAPERFGQFLAYLIPFTVFFLIAFRALHGFLFVNGDSRAKHYWSGVTATAFGFLCFIVINYVPLFAVGHLLIPAQALNAIVSIQFLPLMAILGLVAVFTWRRTNNYVPGALIAGLFVTWYVVAGTAVQFRG